LVLDRKEKGERGGGEGGRGNGRWWWKKNAVGKKRGCEDDGLGRWRRVEVSGWEGGVEVSCWEGEGLRVVGWNGSRSKMLDQ